MDSQFVSRCLAVCLSQGLAELIEQRPPDPIEFLALWILKYKQNQELQLQKSASQRQLEEEQRRLHDESVHQKLLEDEETRIRAAHEQLQQTDAADQTESETLKELSDPPAEDQVINPLNHSFTQKQPPLNLSVLFPHEETNQDESSDAAADEILNTERAQSQEDHSHTQLQKEEHEPEPEKKTEEDPDERPTETEDKEEDDGA